MALRRHPFPGRRIMHPTVTHFVAKQFGSSSYSQRTAGPPLARLNVRARLAHRTDANMRFWRLSLRHGARTDLASQCHSAYLGLDDLWRRPIAVSVLTSIEGTSALYWPFHSRGWQASSRWSPADPLGVLYWYFD